jgi:hypothetical protein
MKMAESSMASMPGMSMPSTKAGGGADATSGASLVGKQITAWKSNATFQIVDSMNMEHHGEMGLHSTIKRTSANDPARAARVMQASLKLLSGLRYDQTLPGSINPNGDHRKIPDSVKAQWKAQYPDLPVPNVLVFDKKSGTAVGVMFVGGAKAPDLGMGLLHEHTEDGAIMQHMWFVPGNMELAFSDTTRKAEAVKAALAR